MYQPPKPRKPKPLQTPPEHPKKSLDFTSRTKNSQKTLEPQLSDFGGGAVSSGGGLFGSTPASSGGGLFGAGSGGIAADLFFVMGGGGGVGILVLLYCSYRIS